MQVNAITAVMNKHTDSYEERTKKFETIQKIRNIDFTNIKFRSGSYDYVIHQGFPSGLYVKYDGKLIFNHQCDVGIYQQLNQRIFRDLEAVAPDSNIDD